MRSIPFKYLTFSSLQTLNIFIKFSKYLWNIIERGNCEKKTKFSKYLFQLWILSEYSGILILTTRNWIKIQDKSKCEFHFLLIQWFMRTIFHILETEFISLNESKRCLSFFCHHVLNQAKRMVMEQHKLNLKLLMFCDFVRYWYREHQRSLNVVPAYNSKNIAEIFFLPPVDSNRNSTSLVNF